MTLPRWILLPAGIAAAFVLLPVAALLARVPWQELPQLLGSQAAQQALLLHHFQLVRQRFGPQKGTILMRKYACCYAQGRCGAREFRRRVAGVSTPAELIDVVAKYFPRESSDRMPD